MMPPKTIFRACIVGSILFPVLAGVIDGVFPALIPEVLREAEDALMAVEFRVQDYLLVALGVPLAITFLAAAAGLYRFHSWAPRVALYVTFASAPMYLLAGAEVLSPLSAMLTDVSMVLWGIVLAMAYLPPVGERFRRLPANSSMQPTGQERPAAD